ncbi:MAG: hypothetical protein ACU0GG_04125 [Paracoccaceae bacterium]
MLFDASPCQSTVSLLEAILFGADGACVDLGLPSLLSALAVFVVGVVVLQWAARRAVRGLFPNRRSAEPSFTPHPAPKPAPEDTGLKPLPYESPIKSTGAWGRTRR